MKHEFQTGLASPCLNPCRTFKNTHQLPQKYQRPLICLVVYSSSFLPLLTEDTDDQKAWDPFDICSMYFSSLMKHILQHIPSPPWVWPGWIANENANSFERESRAVSGR